MELKKQDDLMALIARNLAGVADVNERAKLNNWISESESNRNYFEHVRNIWNESGNPVDPKMINSKHALKKILGRISKPNPVIAIWKYWQRIAAILIIPLAIGSILMLYSNQQKKLSPGEVVYNEVYAAFGTRSAIRLADSSLVWLNAGSSLKYPDKFSSETRQVFLKGEAYFEVWSDASHPFVVNTPEIVVSATGTKFNIFNYESESLAEVTLVSGNVNVKGNDKSNSQLNLDLKHNQHLEYNRQTGANEIIEEDIYKYIAWKDGKLIFRNDPLGEVLDKISLQFNVDIELQGESLKKIRYRATFEEETLDEILKLLKLSSPIDYRELKRYPLPDGSFPKRKIIIFPSRNKNTDY
jgi:ferric-dicitrate binding protein FerR (iron transport regulator)